MTFIRTAAIVLMSAAAITACDDDDDPTTITFDAFVGSWTAQSFVYASANNPATAVDVIGNLNGTLDVNIAANETFSGTIDIPNRTPGPLGIGGSLSLNTGQGTISVDFDAQTESYGFLEDFTADFDVSSDGDTVTWTYDGASFDFDGDGIDEDADVTVVLVAQ